MIGDSIMMERKDDFILNDLHYQEFPNTCQQTKILVVVHQENMQFGL